MLRMLSFDVVCDGFCVEEGEEGSRCLDVACNMGRNMVATWVTWVLCQGEGGGLLMFVCCSQWLATWVAACFDWMTDGLSCFKSNGHIGV
jgi:hypothetical protein